MIPEARVMNVRDVSWNRGTEGQKRERENGHPCRTTDDVW